MYSCSMDEIIMKNPEIAADNMKPISLTTFLYLSNNYKKFKIDFVFDKDEKMVESLKKYNCIFEKDQNVMKLKDYKPVNITYNIVNY